MEYETTEHAVRSCLEAVSVWQWIYNHGICILDNSMEFKDDGDEWVMKFVIIMWYIWKWQNAGCFNSSNTIPADKPNFLLRRFSNICSALKLDELWGREGKEPI